MRRKAKPFGQAASIRREAPGRARWKGGGGDERRRRGMRLNCLKQPTASRSRGAARDRRRNRRSRRRSILIPFRSGSRPLTHSARRRPCPNPLSPEPHVKPARGQAKRTASTVDLARRAGKVFIVSRSDGKGRSLGHAATDTRRPPEDRGRAPLSPGRCAAWSTGRPRARHRGRTEGPRFGVSSRQTHREKADEVGDLRSASGWSATPNGRSNGTCGRR